MKQAAKLMAKSEVQEAVGNVGYENTLVEEINEAFAGLDIALLENAATKAFKKKTKGQYMFLEKDKETIIIAKIGNEYDGIYTNGSNSERILVRNEADLKKLVADKTIEGFTLVKNTREAKGILRRSIRAIVGFIRKHGLKIVIVGALVALTIAFIGPHMAPAVANMATRLGLGGAVLGGAVADSKGMIGVDIEPMPDTIPDNELAAINGVVGMELDPTTQLNDFMKEQQAKLEGEEKKLINGLVKRMQSLYQADDSPEVKAAITDIQKQIADSPKRIEASLQSTRGELEGLLKKAEQTKTQLNFDKEAQVLAASKLAEMDRETDARNAAIVARLVAARSSLFQLQAAGGSSDDIDKQIEQLNKSISSFGK